MGPHKLLSKVEWTLVREYMSSMQGHHYGQAGKLALARSPMWVKNWLGEWKTGLGEWNFVKAIEETTQSMQVPKNFCFPAWWVFMIVTCSAWNHYLNDAVLSWIWPLRTHVNEILFTIHLFQNEEIQFRVYSTKCQPFCLYAIYMYISHLGHHWFK